MGKSNLKKLNEQEIVELAKAGEKMPKGLSTSEIMLFQSTKALIAQFRCKEISAEQAKQEMLELSKAFKIYHNLENYTKYTADLWRALGAASFEFQKERTVENAEKMFEIIYGMKPTEKGENAKYEA